MKIAGAIIAAGTSSRMRQNKLLMPFKNHTIIEEVVSQVLASGIDDIFVITGFENERIENLLKHKYGNNIKIIFNSRYRLGRAESIKCAIRAGQKYDAVLFMVADKPTVTGSLISKAIELFKKVQSSILYVKTPSGRGHPVIFSNKLFSELLTLKGDTVGNEFIERCIDEVYELIDENNQIDIDTMDDYRLVTNQ